MSDRVTLTIRYSFRGETHAPSVTLDLDQAMRNDGKLPDFLLALAKANDIDPYSYDYEMLPFGEFSYSDAEGLAADCIDGDRFDREAFEQRWREREVFEAVAKIAREHLGIERLEPDSAEARALLAAVEYGRRGKGG